MRFKVKERSTDRAFREYILKRDEYTCQRCQRTYRQNDCGGLQVSHFWSRRHENTRFDPANCILLCFGCHMLWGHGDERQAYIDFMKKRLGEEGFQLLDARAHTYKKRDDRLDELGIKNLMLELENKRLKADKKFWISLTAGGNNY